MRPNLTLISPSMLTTNLFFFLLVVRHLVHAADAEEAEALLRRWGPDGMGKIATPNWAKPIKDMLQNQAAARARLSTIRFRQNLFAQNRSGTLDTEERNPQVGPNNLRVVNGNSAFTNTTVSSAQPDSPTTPFRMKQGNASKLDFDPRKSYFGPVNEVSEKSVSEHDETAPDVSDSGTLRRTNSLIIIDIPDDISVSELAADDGHSTFPSQSKTSTGLSVSSSRGWMNTAAGLKFLSGYEMQSGAPDAVDSQFDHVLYPSPIPEDEPTHPVQSIAVPMDPATMSFEPSIATLDRAASAKIYFENLYFPILRQPPSREQRRMALERDLGQMVHLSDVQKDEIRQRWRQNETEYLREKRQKVKPEAFVRLKVIGHGAFGIVTLVRERTSGRLYAMKQV